MTASPWVKVVVVSLARRCGRASYRNTPIWADHRGPYRAVGWTGGEDQPSVWWPLGRLGGVGVRLLGAGLSLGVGARRWGWVRSGRRCGGGGLLRRGLRQRLPRR